MPQEPIDDVFVTKEPTIEIEKREEKMDEKEDVEIDLRHLHVKFEHLMRVLEQSDKLALFTKYEVIFLRKYE